MVTSMKSILFLCSLLCYCFNLCAQEELLYSKEGSIGIGAEMTSGMYSVTMEFPVETNTPLRVTAKLNVPSRCFFEVIDNTGFMVGGGTRTFENPADQSLPAPITVLNVSSTPSAGKFGCGVVWRVNIRFPDIRVGTDSKVLATLEVFGNPTRKKIVFSPTILKINSAQEASVSLASFPSISGKVSIMIGWNSGENYPEKILISMPKSSEIKLTTAQIQQLISETRSTVPTKRPTSSVEIQPNNNYFIFTFDKPSGVQTATLKVITTTNSFFSIGFKGIWHVCPFSRANLMELISLYNP